METAEQAETAGMTSSKASSNGAISSDKPYSAAEANASQGGKKGAVSDAAKKWNADRVKKLKFTYQEAKEYESIESDIAALEEKIEKLESDMLTFATDFIKLKEITETKEVSELLLEEKMERWMYLEDLAKRIAEQ